MKLNGFLKSKTKKEWLIQKEMEMVNQFLFFFLFYFISNIASRTPLFVEFLYLKIYK